MSILKLTIGKIAELIEGIVNFALGQSLPLLKSTFFILSLFFSFFLIGFWLKYELKNKDEIGKWKFFFDSVKRYYFLKKPSKSFLEIKRLFFEDKILAFKELNKFLDFVLETFGYTGSLEEKIKKISPEVLPNLEDLKKTISIWRLIEEKISKGEEINLTDEEHLFLFHQYELILFHLNILTKEDFLVTNLK